MPLMNQIALNLIPPFFKTSLPPLRDSCPLGNIESGVFVLFIIGNGIGISLKQRLERWKAIQVQGIV